jgi:hypothetical protein
MTDTISSTESFCGCGKSAIYFSMDIIAKIIKPTQMSGFLFGGAERSEVELFRKIIT